MRFYVRRRASIFPGKGGMFIYRKEKIKRIKEQYPKGTKVCLEHMEGEAQLPAGLKGTVQFVDDIGQIHVRWENRSSLALHEEVDSFHKIRDVHSRKEHEPER